MNKVVLITGASRGIGRDIAEKLAQKGYQVIANYNRSEEKAKELKSKYANIDIYKADVSRNKGIPFFCIPDKRSLPVAEPCT